MTNVGFAPVKKPNYPAWGNPPINPTKDELNRGRDILIDAIREKSPLLADILSIPVGCDMPEQGGITGTMNRRPDDSLVCYLA